MAQSGRPLGVRERGSVIVLMETLAGGGPIFQTANHEEQRTWKTRLLQSPGGKKSFDSCSRACKTSHSSEFLFNWTRFYCFVSFFPRFFKMPKNQIEHKFPMHLQKNFFYFAWRNRTRCARVNNAEARLVSLDVSSIKMWRTRLKVH